MAGLSCCVVELALPMSLLNAADCNEDVLFLDDSIIAILILGGVWMGDESNSCCNREEEGEAAEEEEVRLARCIRAV